MPSNSANIKAISVAVQAGLPVLLWGSPGIGKTSVIEQMAEKLGQPLEVVIAALREPSDFAGLPVIVNGSVKLSPPNWATRLEAYGAGILLLDELSTAAPAVQAALLRVVLDRMVGDLALPEDIAIIACANPPECSAGGFDLSAPMANRFVHLQWTVDHTEWCDGILSGFPSPDVNTINGKWRDKLPKSRALVSSFINARPTLLNQLPDDETSAGKAWASPRSWDMVSQLLCAWEASNYGDDVLATLVAGSVGEVSAMEFLAYRDNLDLPNPEHLLKDARTLILPERGDRVYAVLSSVTAAVLMKNTPERWAQGWQVLGEACKQGSADIAASSAKALIKNRPDGAALPKEVSQFVPILKGAGLIK